MQSDFFGEDLKKQILDIDGEALLYKGLFCGRDGLCSKMKEEINFTQDEITLYGKTHAVPRLQCFMAKKGTFYSYSGMKLRTDPFSPSVVELKREVEQLTGENFNCVLINLYRSGLDYVAWHSDDEKELGPSPTIASLSFGESRWFHLRHKTNKSIETIKLSLNDGDLLLMKGETQKYWKHQLAKTSVKVGERLNFTFRKIISNGS